MSKQITWEELKAILKISDEKPEKIKLAKGIFLNGVERTDNMSASTYNGISSEKYISKWFMLPHGRAIFKSYDGDYAEVKEMRIANELICQELARRMGIGCANYELATFDDITGLISYDVAKKDQYIMSAFELMVATKTRSDKMFHLVLESAQKYCEKYDYTYDKKEIVLGLYRIMIFDALTLQSDRHMNNIFLVFDKNDKTMKVAPLIDNELSFNIVHSRFALADGFEVTPDDIRKDLRCILKQLTVVENYDKQSLVQENIKQIVDMAKMNPEMDKVLRQMLRDFDVSRAAEMIAEKGVELNQEYTDYLLSCEKVVKGIFKDEYTRENREIKKYNYEPIME